MKVLVLRGSREKGATEAYTEILGEVWVKDNQVWVGSDIPEFEEALAKDVVSRLKAGPIFRKYPRYLGPQDAPHTIIDAREPIEIVHPDFLKWFRSERSFWETKPFAGYFVDATYSGVIERP